MPSQPGCRQTHSNDTVPLSRAFFCRSGEAIELVENAYVRESSSREDANELCFQQSTGDSTRPQVDVSKCAVGQDFADHDVRNLRAPATLEHACDLADSSLFVCTRLSTPFEITTSTVASSNGRFIASTSRTSTFVRPQA